MFVTILLLAGYKIAIECVVIKQMFLFSTSLV